MMRRGSFLFLILGISLLACERRPKAPPKTTRGDSPLAKVGQTIITDKELLSTIEKVEKTLPRNYSTHPQKKALLQEMMNIELLYQAAIDQGFEQHYEFKTRMADLYVQELAEHARKSMTEAQVEKFYKERQDQLDQISARHILLKFPKNVTNNDKKEMRTKISQWREELLKEPARFEEYAKNYSEDGSKGSGGELGFFNRLMMVKPFSDAAFKLQKIGDISPVVESQFGYHIIQLSGDRRGIEFHRDSIRDQLVRSTQREWLDKELERLKRGKTFEIYEDLLSQLSALPAEVTTEPETLVPKHAGTKSEKKSP